MKDHDSKGEKVAVVDPRRFFRRVLKGARAAVTTTLTALGNVASESAGTGDR